VAVLFVVQVCYPALCGEVVHGDSGAQESGRFAYWVGETSRLFGTVGNAIRQERSIFTENQFETSY
jgi:hypothetical protein